MLVSRGVLVWSVLASTVLHSFIMHCMIVGGPTNGGAHYRRTNEPPAPPLEPFRRLEPAVQSRAVSSLSTFAGRHPLGVSAARSPCEMKLGARLPDFSIPRLLHDPTAPRSVTVTPST